MTPGARIQGSIEILEGLLATDRPADRFLTHWFRARRYAGSKDRRAIREKLFFVLRHFHQLQWCCGEGASVRSIVLASLLLSEKQSVSEITKQCDGVRYRPSPLADAEIAMLTGLESKSIADVIMPRSARYNLADWLFEKAETSFSSKIDEELAVLATQAPLDLRVNVLKSDRVVVSEALASAAIDAVPTPLSPIGLRIEAHQSLTQVDVFREGLIEVQDEGSQLVSLLCDAHPGMRVLDFCAGAGGKSLAIAAAMGNQGSITLCDLDMARLHQAKKRLARAGVTIGKTRLVARENDPWIAGQVDAFDRVLVDAPCSGSGAWRRHPEARLRLTKARFGEFCVLQRDLLLTAALLVRPGGRLIYATCSLFKDENQEVVDFFMDQRSDYKALTIESVWQETLGESCPGKGSSLQLTPFRNSTDGFFVAILERKN
jgi:16S rRNA (cytosine967-C5)-methyltransferase